MTPPKLRLTGLAALALSLSAMLPAAASPFDTVNKSTDATLSAFESVYIAPVSIDLPEDTRRTIRDIHSDRPVSERDQAQRAGEFRKDLERAFGRKFTLADAPGPGVLTVEATLTRLASSRATLADIDAAGGLFLDFGSTVYAGGAGYKARLSDGDAELAQITDDYQSSLNDGQPRVGIWQDADRAFSRFSRQLAKYASEN